MTTQIQLRRDTAPSWTSNNPTLAAGELGFELDTGKFKIGNGSVAWNTLDYASSGSGTVTASSITGGTLASNVTASSLTSFGTSPSLTKPTTTSLAEVIGTISSTSGTIAYSYDTATVFYHTSSPTSGTAGWVANFTNVPTTADRAYNFTVVVPQGGTASFVSAVQIAGSAATVKWAGSTAAPTGNASKTDVWVFSLIRVSGAWTVLGVQSANFG